MKRIVLKTPVREREYILEISENTLKISREIPISHDEKVVERTSYIFKNYKNLLEKVKNYIRERGEIEIIKAVRDKNLHSMLGLFHYVPTEERESYKANLATYFLILAASELDERIEIDKSVKPMTTFYKPDYEEIKRILSGFGVEETQIKNFYNTFNLQNRHDVRMLNDFLFNVHKFEGEIKLIDKPFEMRRETIFSCTPSKESERNIIFVEKMKGGKVYLKGYLTLNQNPLIRLVKELPISSIGGENENLIDEETFNLLFPFFSDGEIDYQLPSVSADEKLVSKVCEQFSIFYGSNQTIIMTPKWMKKSELRELLGYLRKKFSCGGYFEKRSIRIFGIHPSEEIKKVIAEKVLGINL